MLPKSSRQFYSEHPNLLLFLAVLFFNLLSFVDVSMFSVLTAIKRIKIIRVDPDVDNLLGNTVCHRQVILKYLCSIFSSDSHLYVDSRYSRHVVISIACYYKVYHIQINKWESHNKPVANILACLFKCPLWRVHFKSSPPLPGRPNLT